MLDSKWIRVSNKLFFLKNCNVLKSSNRARRQPATVPVTVGWHRHGLPGACGLNLVALLCD